MAVVVSAVAVLSLGTPAFAGEQERWFHVGGDATHENYIDIYAKVYIRADGATNYVFSDSGVRFGAKATSATGCKITSWVILRTWANPNTWEGPRTTFSCANALAAAGPMPASERTYDHWAGYTSGQGAQARTCVDLYYNYSSSSGWQRCYTTDLIWTT
ncbi:hypothetical protein AB0J82_18790 [Asanoa sp. NPDC049518]|uniref:hypothetical protein n=1 Tax=unclassified Asanoa TaxID=2685164 RepID=UPI00342DDA66